MKSKKVIGTNIILRSLKEKVRLAYCKKWKSHMYGKAINYAFDAGYVSGLKSAISEIESEANIFFTESIINYHR